jgi:hypothetical protein
LARAGLKRREGGADRPIMSLVYNDPFSPLYKKYIFTLPGMYLLGEEGEWDLSNLLKLVAIGKKVRFSSFIFFSYRIRGSDFMVIPAPL